VEPLDAFKNVILQKLDQLLEVVFLNNFYLGLHHMSTTWF